MSNFDQQKQIIKKATLEIKAEIAALQVQYDRLSSEKANLSFELERELSRKKPGLWWILVISLWALSHVAWGNEHYIVCIICTFAFLALYRQLWVPKATGMPLAVLVVAISVSQIYG